MRAGLREKMAEREQRQPQATPATGTSRADTVRLHGTPTRHTYLPARTVSSPNPSATWPPKLLPGCREREGRSLCIYTNPETGHAP